MSTITEIQQMQTVVRINIIFISASDVQCRDIDEWLIIGSTFPPAESILPIREKAGPVRQSLPFQSPEELEQLPVVDLVLLADTIFVPQCTRAEEHVLSLRGHRPCVDLLLRYLDLVELKDTQW